MNNVIIEHYEYFTEINISGWVKISDWFIFPSDSGLFRIVVQSLSCDWLCDAVDCSMPDCPSLFPGVCSNSLPLSQWYCLTISSYIALLYICLQFFRGSGSFPMSWLFTSDGQSIGVSVLASVLLINIQSWFPLGLTSLVSLGLSSLLQHHNSKASILCHSALFMVQLSYP